MAIEFQKVVRKARLLAPPGFEPEEQPIEYRKDPLTGSCTRINIKRAARPKQMEIEEDLRPFIDWTRQGCYFCPENIERNTPLFMTEVSKEGRINKKDCWLFPNRLPFAEYQGVATLSDAHFLDLDQFTVDQIKQNLFACQQFVLAVHRSNREAKYPIWIWNHLPPSAASIIHPHTQILVDRVPTPFQDRLLQASKEYFLKEGRNYWQDLVSKEKELGERYVAGNDSLHILTSFAPMGNREIMFVFNKASSFTDLDQKQITDFADATLLTLKWYKEEGVNSFNLCTFSSAVDFGSNYYALNARLISRPVFRPYYTTFGGPLELFHWEYVVDTPPEEVAKRLRLSPNPITRSIH